MEEYNNTEKNGNKRTRDESGLDHSPDSKRVHSSLESHRVEPELEVKPNSSGSSPNDRVDSTGFDENVDLDSPEAKQIREDILDILDEPETVTEIHDLESVIKSFEEEIVNPPNMPPQQTFIDLTLSDSGDSESDLGYLLEASDVELGLPPTENHVDAESGLVNSIGLENGLLRYDSFHLGMLAGIMDGDNYGGDSDGDFVTVGGLFDYPDPSDFSEFSWRPESLPAL